MASFNGGRMEHGHTEEVCMEVASLMEGVMLWSCYGMAASLMEGE